MLYLGFVSSQNILSKDDIIYIEKDTGLLVKIENSTQTIEKIYEFNNVSDDIFIEPNIDDYTLYTD